MSGSAGFDGGGMPGGIRSCFSFAYAVRIENVGGLVEKNVFSFKKRFI